MKPKFDTSAPKSTPEIALENAALNKRGEVPSNVYLHGLCRKMAMAIADCSTEFLCVGYFEAVEAANEYLQMTEAASGAQHFEARNHPEPEKTAN